MFRGWKESTSDTKDVVSLIFTNLIRGSLVVCFFVVVGLLHIELCLFLFFDKTCYRKENFAYK
jgi:hypothetical protein